MEANTTINDNASAKTTRERILEAAMDRFSRQSYDQTGLREIAGDVGVDVAYVHRCFGSKGQLFAAALEQILHSSKNIPDSTSDLPDELASSFVSSSAPDACNRLDIFIRSMTNEETADMLRAYLQKGVIAPIAEQTGSERNAALILSWLVGLSIMRNVLKLDHLQRVNADILEREIARVIAFIIEEGTSAAPTPRRMRARRSV